MQHQNKKTVEQIFKIIFALSDDIDLTSVKRNEYPTWDSLAHVNLLIALESEFSTRFNSDDAESITSFSTVEQLLDKKGF